MDVNWQAVGAIGEFVGAAATVLTLAYLAVQIRHSGRSSRSVSYQAAVTSVAEWTRAIGSDQELSLLVNKGSRDLDSLSEGEMAQYAFLVTSLVRNFENIHYQYENGLLDEMTWSAWVARIHGTLSSPGMAAWWNQQKTAFSPTFRAFVDSSPVAVAEPDSVQPLPEVPWRPHSQ